VQFLEIVDYTAVAGVHRDDRCRTSETTTTMRTAHSADERAFVADVGQAI
jgi:hypothetical protein